MARTTTTPPSPKIVYPQASVACGTDEGVAVVLVPGEPWGGMPQTPLRRNPSLFADTPPWPFPRRTVELAATA
jgi:hypothetical protein